MRYFNLVVVEDPKELEKVRKNYEKNERGCERRKKRESSSIGIKEKRNCVKVSRFPERDFDGSIRERMN